MSLRIDAIWWRWGNLWHKLKILKMCAWRGFRRDPALEVRGEDLDSLYEEKKKAAEASDSLPGQGKTPISVSSSLHIVEHSSSPMGASTMLEWGSLPESVSREVLKESRLLTSLLQAAAIAVHSFVTSLSDGAMVMHSNAEKEICAPSRRRKVEHYEERCL